MSRISSIFTQLRADNRKALMPFVCGGHPRPGSTPQLLAAMQRAGASIVEVGIPFSDPIADGPVIAAAMHEALKQGSTPASVFQEVAAARPDLSIGLVAMVSISIVHRSGGPEEFCSRASTAGFDGLIIPDSPLEESAAIIPAAAANGLTLSFLVSPTTNPKRAEQIAKASTGFVYLLARVGITGEQGATPQIAPAVQRLRQHTDLPIAVGFGVSNADHVRAVVAHADAAIVGSAMVRRISSAAAEGQDCVPAAESFAKELVAGLS